MSSFQSLIEQYLNSSYTNEELEAKFGTIRNYPSIHRNDFERIIKLLYSKGFQISQEQYLLRIQPIMKQERQTPRIEITGIKPIQNYCITNSLLNQKTQKLNSSTYFVYKKHKAKPYDNKAYSVRISYQIEQILKNEDKIQTYIQQWDTLLKIFRHMKRISLTHPSFPSFRIDMSIVKQSSLNTKYKQIPRRTIQESNVFNNDPQYEIEIEYIKSKSSDKEDVYSKFKTLIQYILSGWQSSLYPVSFDTIENIKKDYASLIYGEPRRLYSKHFVGYSSVSLETKHLTPLDTSLTLRQRLKYNNLNNPYVITDKADGERRLLYISNNGSMYTIDTNMNFHYTGMKSTDYKQTLLDGEYISHDIHGQFIDLYMAFDIYYIQGQDIRSYPFAIIPSLFDTIKDDIQQLPMNKIVNELSNVKTRFLLLNKVIQGTTSTTTISVPFKLFMKHFEYTDGNTITYPKAIKHIFEHKDTGDLYPILKQQNIVYNNDGVIMTPMLNGVGMDWFGQEPSNTKITWTSSFKWKPPEFNTIDFLVLTHGNVNTTMKQGEIIKYQTCILNVGYDERRHGYTNPYQQMLNAEFKEQTSKENEQTQGYRPKPFYPIQPEDKYAHTCNIQIKNNVMMIEDETDTFTNGTIVEFKYDLTKPVGWRWIPIRVRHDKTYEFINGEKNFGNAYHVAQSVWSSIHHPVTKEMLISGTYTPNIIQDDDVYYYGVKGKSQTLALRDFHNLYVKKELILRTSKTSRNKTLVDIAVGKAGDLPKWILSKLKFILGLDVSKDNIYNRIDGACSRYLNYKKTNHTTPNCLFVVADSSKYILNGEACLDDIGKRVIQALQEEEIHREKISDELGKGVAPYVGFLNTQKFHIVSCQFAFHYFWNSIHNLHTCIRNICDLCELNGYFIGTSYNGHKIFELLKDKRKGEQVELYKHGHKIWSIIKQYDHTSYLNDKSCIGYEIDVYQETIGQYFKEYLVNYEYLIQLLSFYGFEPVPKDELKRTFMLKHSIGNFEDMYKIMMNKIRKDKKNNISKTLKETGKAIQLQHNRDERMISFLNQYFIFKKVRHVDSEQVMKSFLNGSYSVEQTKDVPTPSSTKQTFKQVSIPTIDHIAEGS